ncbi:myb/SANT-like DNA-binding domain-containing protein 3 [Leptopilina heterotoma]|uniref:myb/SANT-like DNA-binding domain-containing protein 3 n=1 Tax=Leptopilina heterotoma TaxID=63436 RepID=UPI001CA94EF5|nr:myb/SANT-like DNA-binding domain-containing protein 3 [Leptopilina heterotoma]
MRHTNEAFENYKKLCKATNKGGTRMSKGTKARTETKKRERSQNFTLQEVSDLLNIVDEYKHIVECKQTDSVTWKEKDIACEKIASDFNSIYPTKYRSQRRLKNKYEGLKKAVKAKGANNRKESFRTGGGLKNAEDEENLPQSENGEIDEPFHHVFYSKTVDNESRLSTLQATQERNVLEESFSITIEENNQEKIHKFENQEKTVPEGTRKCCKSSSVIDEGNMAETKMEVQHYQLLSVQDEMKNKEEESRIKQRILEVELEIKKKELEVITLTVNKLQNEIMVEENL